MKSIIEIMYMAGIDPDELANEIEWNPNNNSEITFTYYSGTLMGLYLGGAITRKEHQNTKSVLHTLRFGMIRPNY